ncbi:MAG: SH3 domain-containing protein [Chloroflexi bacterium]|nr:SH3 domain-containing protein [Chloroflexota bacterium]
MQRRRLALTLTQLVLAVLLAALPLGGGLARADEENDHIDAAVPAGLPEGQAAPRPPAVQQAAGNNNIIGLNVARLRRPRYVEAAAELVNANGGDWGYLTVVFTADERDSATGDQLLQELLDRCYENHLQPIIRVATRFDVEAETWSRPDPDDAERWRAFLERGKWPVAKVWVIAGNEANLGREWGGEVDAAGYARYLENFLDVFADSERFMVANGPLDASNTTEMPKMQDAYEFLGEMDAAVPGIFARLNGWASNPYMVPHQGPELRYTHRAYESELAFIGRDMPVLITEAGHLNTGDEKEIAAFYEEAFRDWMADSRVVAVTPLFWHPDRGVYWMFDFDKDNQVIEKSATYDLIMRLPRGRGSPTYAPDLGNVARGAPRGRPADGAAQTTALGPRPGPGERTGADSRSVDEITRPPLRVANTEGAGARLRAEPSRSAPVLKTVPEGASVIPTGPAERHGDLLWRPVRLDDGLEGWIAMDFLVAGGGR